MTALAPQADGALDRPPRTSLGVAIPGDLRPGRLDMVDLVRGVAIVLMVLDHVRAYLGNAHFDPTDLSQTSPALFATRWITHFCAPAFVLLAGAGAWLSGRRRSCAELSRFLLKRGAWLLVLEFTVISFGWYFNLRFEHGFMAQVIWAIGVSMLVLAALVQVRIRTVALVGVALVAGHNLFDGVVPANLGPFAPLWALLHVQAPLGWAPVFVVYPLLPWIGVMALGFALGPLLNQGDDEARLRLRFLGVAAIAGFVVLRIVNLYGDPRPWMPEESGALRLLSFLNVTKYPPSLLYLLMTLGPTLVLLSLPYPAEWRVAGWLRTLGRAPLFFYVAHLYLIHALALGLGVVQGYAPRQFQRAFMDFPLHYGLDLGGVYLAWGLVVVALYPPTRWFACKKRRGRGWWWSYL